MNNIKILRFLAIFEGISYIVLLGICMPLKYIWDIPEPTRPIGMAHGALFVAYIIWVVIVGQILKWNIKIHFWGFIASLLPFGTFIFEKKYLKTKAIA